MGSVTFLRDQPRERLRLHRLIVRMFTAHILSDCDPAFAGSPPGYHLQEGGIKVGVTRW